MNKKLKKEITKDWEQEVFKRFAEIVWYLEKFGLKGFENDLTIDGKRNYQMKIKFMGYEK